MIAATYNCNSVRTRLGIISEWLDEKKPDILALQETKVQDAQFPFDAFIKLGYHAVFRGEKSYNGVAFILRDVPEEIIYGFGESEEEAARLLSIKVNGTWFINTYIPQGYSIDSEKYTYKLQWFDRLKKYFEQNFTPDQKILWCGDFNVALTDADVHNPKRLAGHVCFNPQVQQKLSEINNFGFYDILRKYNPDSGVYTYWDYRVKNALDRNIGWRIDYIQATKPLAERSKQCTIETGLRKKERPSDHTLVYAEFED